MKIRTAVFIFACLIFGAKIIDQYRHNAAIASFESTPWRATNGAKVSGTEGTLDALNKVDVSVFSIARGSAGIKIKNISSERLASVFLECTFRDQYGARIDSVPVFVSNLAAGDTANEVANMPNDIKASTVSCRTNYAHGS